MVSDNIRLRGEFLNTQVITRNTGNKLGIVKDVLVDIDRREVVVLGLKNNILALSGLPKYMYFSTIRQTGDVVLVEDEDVIEDIDILPYSTLINSEVITETGEPLGRVRDFQFSLEDGKVYSIIIASVGIPQIPEQVLSTYEIPMEEVVSSGPNRLILFEGAQERLRQLTVGVLERLGLGRPPWEKDNDDVYYAPTARPENQLGTGIPLRTPVIETREPVAEELWEEEAERLPPKKTKAMRYEEYPEPPKKEFSPPAYEDVWEDEAEDDDYTPPRVNLEQKQKERKIEYEE